MNDQAHNLRKLVQSKYSSSSQIRETVVNASMDMDVNDIRKSRIIAITSGKGGVGKTNLTVNLAIALSMLGKRVLIIDADLGMANVDVILGTSSKYSLLNLMEDDISIGDVISKGPCGITYLSGGSGMEQLANLSYNEFEKITKKLYSCEDFTDIILLDTGAGLGRNVLNFLVAADEVILVTTPEPTAMTDAYAIMKAFSVYSNNEMSLVVNRVFDDDEGVAVVNKLTATAGRFLNLSITSLGEVYEDRNLIKAVKAQKPLLLAYPNTISTKGIKAIAERILVGNHQMTKKGLRAFLEKLMNFIR